MSGVDFSFLSWQPRITKQAPGYNDPKACCSGLYDKITYIEEVKSHSSKQCIVTDTKTGESKTFPTLKDAGEYLNCCGRNVGRSISKGYLIQDRYRAEFV